VIEIYHQFCNQWWSVHNLSCTKKIESVCTKAKPETDFCKTDRNLLWM